MSTSKINTLFAGIIDTYHGDKFANDWPDGLRVDGICACILKASQSDTTVDPIYAARRKAMRACGFLTGSYHFGTSKGQAADQAKFYINTCAPGPDELVCLDWECQDPDGTPSELDMTVAHAEHFIEEVFKQLSRWPVLYTGYAFLLEHKDQISKTSAIVQCPWWIARYGTKPPDSLPFKKDWTLWQYDDEAQIHGIKNLCDRNRFNGDKDTLARVWPL